ncbi:dTMP kinase [SAR86 cluster bacterium]|jgi:dTMP kinase|nr:dTMP kinase [SAR86 cluster bacterium]
MFITLEGIEGSGKSTLIKNLNNYLLDLDIDVLFTREPGATITGKNIRNLLLSPNTDLSSEAELLLIMADRVEHIKNIIAPNLNLNKLVISDRYIDSTIAYQGGGRGIKIKLIESLIKNLKMPIPDLTFLIDINVEIGLKRAKDRAELDRFEKEEINFHKRVRDAYLKIAKKDPERVIRINGNQEEESVFNDVKHYLEIKLAKR